MKNAYVYIAFVLVIMAVCLSACAEESSLTVDFDAEPAGQLFSVDLYDGTTAVCVSASMDFDFKNDIVDSCRVTLVYDSEKSAAAVSEFWETYSGIENTEVEGTTVTYNYIIDAGSDRSSKFSGMTTNEVTAEVEKFGGVVRG